MLSRLSNLTTAKGLAWRRAGIQAQCCSSFPGRGSGPSRSGGSSSSSSPARSQPVLLLADGSQKSRVALQPVHPAQQALLTSSTRHFAFNVGSSVSDPESYEALLREDRSEPPYEKLRMLTLASAFPYLGFGFLDNFIMIIAGEAIDSTLCVTFCFSTMAAAAIGNTVSDVCGLFSGSAVESIAERFGVENPALTREQAKHWKTKTYQLAGQIVGIVIGCMLGCAPLLWIDAEEAARLKREKEKTSIFQTVVEKVGDILRAEGVALVLLDDEQGDCFAANVSPNVPVFRACRSGGFLGHVISTGHFINIADMQEEATAAAEGSGPPLPDIGMTVQSTLLMPIFSGDKILGVMAVFNKQGNGIFTPKDEDILSSICTHVSAVLVGDQTNFLQILTTCERSVDKQGSLVWGTASKQRQQDLFPPAMGGINDVLDAEASYLMLINEATGELYTETVVGGFEKRTEKVGASPAGVAVEKGQVVCLGEEELRSRFGDVKYLNEKGESVPVKSVVCVPLFNTSRKCLGCIEVINKHNATDFDKEDKSYLDKVSYHISMMIEGESAALRRIVAMSRMKMQHKDVLQQTRGAAVICHLESAQNLPITKDERGVEEGLDPYVTLCIIRGDPLANQDEHFTQRMLRRRERDRQQTIRRFCRSKTVSQDANPTWHETIAVVVPRHYRDVPSEELFVHLVVWDYDPLNDDKILAQAAFPLSQMPSMTPKGAKMYTLQPPPGQEGAWNSRLWISFARQ
eukprot:CAMPEP_0178387594 /NCGR_PEP_ID=MMETSP0689_2-20121128/9154_1 /TAXON_ID=160604 /ORGANISM="Amphidinium massartii, Strain CS-259" /LENGTH=744 /DNA_ID=CAMNT_0020007963 /DNA_START=57 /DNA_END=2288 /DNA_ORIENTATION=-